jgi:transcription initiation factor IIE alpha subunit
MNTKKKKRTNLDKIIRVLMRRKTPLTAASLAEKAGVNYNSVRRIVGTEYGHLFYRDQIGKKDSKKYYWLTEATKESISLYGINSIKHFLA